MSGKANKKHAGEAVWQSRITGDGEIRAGELLLNPHNWRVHNAYQTAALTDVLERVGWVQRVIVNKRSGFIVDGHLRAEMALRKGEDTLVPVVYVDLSDAEEALVLATFDPISALATKNVEQLSVLLSGWKDSAEGALRRLFQTLAPQVYSVPPDGNEGANQLAALQKKYKIKLGSIFEVGPRKHRVMCGDSTSEANVAALLSGERPMITTTDPPYGVEYDPAWRAKAAEQGHLAYASRRVGKVSNDDRADWREAWALCPGAVIYCWHAGLMAPVVMASLEACGFEIRSQIVWVKSNYPISRGNYHWRHEPCWYGVRKGAKASWIGDRKQTTVWEISLDENIAGGHGTQKPVECMAKAIRNHEGDVYDPFVGSGTTIAAAEASGRRGFGMDIDPGYVGATLERLAKMGLTVAKLK